jgi:hypothetical protein
MLRNEHRPSLQVNRLGLIEAHRFIHAYRPLKDLFHLVFGERPELASVGFEPDVFRSVSDTTGSGWLLTGQGIR